jgi:hypothetical protein
VWITFTIALFCMPTAIPVTPQTMNYASVVFAGFSTIAALWYVAYGHKNYHGPQVAVLARRMSTASASEGSRRPSMASRRSVGEILSE